MEDLESLVSWMQAKRILCLWRKEEIIPFVLN